MTGVFETDNSILLQNTQVCIEISKENAQVLAVTDRVSGRNIRGEATCFFLLSLRDGTSVIPTALLLEGNVIKAETGVGAFAVKVDAEPDYFVLTLITPLPETAYMLTFGHVKYLYDYANKANTGACGIAMTYWVNPVYYPDAKSMETRGEIIRHLRDIGGKYALIIAPIKRQREIIQKASCGIDKTEGVVSEIGGAWGRDSRLNFGNYLIEWESDQEHLRRNLPYYKQYGVDQVDFHQGDMTFRQGDFKFERYASASEFKKKVSDVLNAEGIQSGLHSYSAYVRYDCDTILADPEQQKDLSILETFTLAEDIGEDALFVPTVESTAEMSKDYGFTAKNTPFVLIGEELIRFEHAPNGFRVAERGAAGTKIQVHRAGDTVKHVDGYYNMIAPIPGSKLFLQIARNTAKAFHEGGFRMIYLDALDGIKHHCDEDEGWYYTAMFVCEVLQHCRQAPLLEYSTILPAIWPGRGRIGAYDYPIRAYKRFNAQHAKDNEKFIDRYSAPTLGWYNYYPMKEQRPGNEHTKYHHLDAVEHMGALSVIYDFGTVHFIGDATDIDRYAGLRRNIETYRKYDDLRKKEYFSEQMREKLREGDWEYHLKEKENKEYTFEEKDYQSVKLYDLSDPERCTGTFFNPFDGQVPFVRIEALLSAAGGNPVELMRFDEEQELKEQELVAVYPQEVDLNERLAKLVRVQGNGVPGSAIAIKTQCETFKSIRGFREYIIDTDFEGWREFVLVETDNGERPDLSIDDNEQFTWIHRYDADNHVITKTEIKTAGNVQGVRMGSITACSHAYEVLKNPTVRIGNTEVLFECELMSTDFIEFDGTTAKVIDRYGNEKKIWFRSSLLAPSGEFRVSLTAKALNGHVPRAKLTLGFTGKEVL